MSVSWEFFAGKRSVTLREILEAEGVKSYADLVLTLKKMGVRAPAEKEVAWMFNEKSDRIQIPCDPEMSIDEMMDARKKITEIVMEDDPDALVPQIKVEKPTGGIKPLGNQSVASETKKAPQRRKSRTRRTTKSEK